uniref:Uncharacterized protein n=1 Tax=Rhizophora mucronata TaxID=61149 RepID=A0A2P2PKK5_RHIMU
MIILEIHSSKMQRYRLFSRCYCYSALLC